MGSLIWLTSAGLRGLWPFKSDRKALARTIAARTKPRFIAVPPERRRSRVPFTKDELCALRGGRSAEEYRLWLIRTYLQE